MVQPTFDGRRVESEQGVHLKFPVVALVNGVENKLRLLDVSKTLKLDLEDLSEAGLVVPTTGSLRTSASSSRSGFIPRRGSMCTESAKRSGAACANESTSASGALLSSARIAFSTPAASI